MTTLVRVVPQDTWYSHPLPCGAVAGALVVSGHWLLQQGTFGSTFLQFLAKTQATVEARLDQYLAAHPEVDPGTSNEIVLDIENPHPQDLHTYSAADQDAIVSAYKTRIAAARSKFPNAKLGLFGTLNPDARGRASNAGYQARLGALIEAGAEGLYDQLDVLVPVLYTRFGPLDSGWGTEGAYTQLGVDGSRQLSPGKPLLPFVAPRVLNGNSNQNNALLLDLGLPDPPLAQTLGSQRAVLAAAGVLEMALWVGLDQDRIADPNPNGWTVSDYVSGF